MSHPAEQTPASFYTSPHEALQAPPEQFVYVANANSDTVSVISTKHLEVVETIRCRPAARLPFGSGSRRPSTAWPRP